MSFFSCEFGYSWVCDSASVDSAVCDDGFCEEGEPYMILGCVKLLCRQPIHPEPSFLMPVAAFPQSSV